MSAATTWYPRDASAYTRPNISPALVKKLHLPHPTDSGTAKCSRRIVICNDQFPVDGWDDPPEDLKCRRCLRTNPESGDSGETT